MALQRAHRPTVGVVANVVGARPATVDAVDEFVMLQLHDERAEDALSHRGPADVAQADEEN